MAQALTLLHLTVIVAALSVGVIGGEEGPCRFEGDFCSCKFGKEKQGICWDQIAGVPSPTSCRSRFCRAGWVCSCPGRTHVCVLKERVVNVIDERFTNDTATCHKETLLKTVPPFLKLGSWNPSISQKGLAANACSELAWWHNGVLMGVYGKEPQITGANLGAQMVRRTKHVLLELQKNDTIAFRFKNGSYHCYNHFSNLNVNGVNVTTKESSIETLYSRGHTSNWFMPSFVPNVKQDLDEASITDFTPLRPTMSNGAPDVIGEDNWKAVDGSEDHMISNFYFRMTIKF